MSKQTTKLNIVANLPFFDISMQIVYCCKVHVYHAPVMDFNVQSENLKYYSYDGPNMFWMKIITILVPCLQNWGIVMTHHNIIVELV
jgi:hypothetical protein